MLKTTTPQASQQPGQAGETLYSLSPVKTSEQVVPGVVQPSWIRLPKSGQQCPYTGLTRSVLNGLILGNNAPVRSLSLRKQYALKGTRLIHLGSLLAYLDGVALSQNQQTEN